MREADSQRHRSAGVVAREEDARRVQVELLTGLIDRFTDGVLRALEAFVALRPKEARLARALGTFAARRDADVVPQAHVGHDTLQLLLATLVAVQPNEERI